jgi:hypothetical protein
MSFLPDLRVVPLTSIMPHERVDPLRVERLATRIEAEGSQMNPMLCIEDLTGRLVLLDGATRTAALQRLQLPDAVVQVVIPDTVTLEAWHHVIRGAAPEDVAQGIKDHGLLPLAAEEGPPLLLMKDGGRWTISGDELTEFGVLSALVRSYIGRWPVNRVTSHDLNDVPRRFPDWGAVVEFPTLTIGDVTKAALGEDYLPAGITRFIVPDRALRVNVPLELLRASGSTAERQALLDELVDERTRAGSIRHYPQAVFIFDE